MSSKFDSMHLNQLRDEQRKRHAKTSGRKKELERLDAYDRNSNFGRPDSPLQSEYAMKVPDPMSYQDLNSDKKFAAVSMEGIVSYLATCTFEKYFDNTPVGLYKEKYMCYIRVHDSGDQDCYFVKSACRAEMKKSVVYRVDLRVSREGEVLESQCECGAGMGPTAHCKHVCTLLYACYVFGLIDSVNVESTCTEKLLLEPQKCTSNATDHGKKYEKVATKEYERLHHCHTCA